MMVYLDSSVVLRWILGQPGALSEWAALDSPVTSTLTELECLRTLDRRRISGFLSPSEIATFRATTFDFLSRVLRIELSRPVLSHAAQPFPTPLGSQNAIHLATALLWREQQATELVLATHDAELALAARASGLSVIGAT